MFREARNSLSADNTSMRSSSPQGTPPSGGASRKGRYSRSGSRDVTPEGSLDRRRGSLNLLDNSELSPLKQFQRMKENGTLKLNPRNRRSIDGNQSDPCDATNGSDKENRNFLRMSMTMMDVPSRRSSSIGLTGAADLNGAGPSLLKISSEVNIHTSRTSLNPAESNSNVSTCTNMSTSSNASSYMRTSQSASTHNLQKPRSRSEEPKEIVLGHVMGEPIYAPSTVTIMPVITDPEHPASRKSATMPPTSSQVPLEKPKIEVKLVRNERPRSSYRMSKSVEELDRADDNQPENPIYSRFIRHAGSNLRNSFIEKKRDTTTQDNASDVHNVQNVIKSEKSDKQEEEIYSLPQPQSYSESTLKAVKTITDKYDTLQMRKLRALSFRESNKSGSSEPNSPTTEHGGESKSETRESTPEISPEDFLKQSQEDISAEEQPAKTETFEPLPVPVPVPEKPRSKPPLPPLPPPNLRGPSLRKGTNRQKAVRTLEVPSHFAVVDPDAIEDSAFMIEPKAPEPEDERDSVMKPPEVVLEPNTEGEEVVCVSSGITQKDVSRIDLFFRSRETEVVVSQCLVDMIMGTSDPATGHVDMWSSVCHTGVLVLVLNSGLGKRRREMFVVLAERETGFPLWQDRVNYLTNYRDIQPTLHQLQPSNNLRMRVGFRFYCGSASSEFISKYRELTANPNDDLWKVANSRMDKNRRAMLKKLRLKKRPSKGDISQPCNFAHVTKLDTKDYVHYESFHDLLPKSPVNSASGKGAVFRPRLQTT